MGGWLGVSWACVPRLVRSAEYTTGVAVDILNFMETSKQISMPHVRAACFAPAYKRLH